MNTPLNDERKSAEDPPALREEELLLSRFVDGDVTDEERTRVHTLVAQDDELAAFLTQLQRSRGALRNTAALAPPEDMPQRVRRAIAAAEQNSQPRAPEDSNPHGVGSEPFTSGGSPWLFRTVFAASSIGAVGAMVFLLVNPQGTTAESGGPAQVQRAGSAVVSATEMRVRGVDAQEVVALAQTHGFQLRPVSNDETAYEWISVEPVPQDVQERFALDLRGLSVRAGGSMGSSKPSPGTSRLRVFVTP